ncbi:hypothetical protein QBC44DRAFT_384936, partial [Cladorrhinum sp. PSN332]
MWGGVLGPFMRVITRTVVVGKSKRKLRKRMRVGMREVIGKEFDFFPPVLVLFFFFFYGSWGFRGGIVHSFGRHYGNTTAYYNDYECSFNVKKGILLGIQSRGRDGRDALLSTVVLVHGVLPLFFKVSCTELYDHRTTEGHGNGILNSVFMA